MLKIHEKSYGRWFVSFFSLFLFILKNTEKIPSNAYGLAKRLLLVKMIYLFYFLCVQLHNRYLNDKVWSYLCFFLTKLEKIWNNFCSTFVCVFVWITRFIGDASPIIIIVIIVIITVIVFVINIIIITIIIEPKQ